MIKKKDDLIEERLLTPKEIDERISLLQRQKISALAGEIKPKALVRISDFEKISEEEVFDYQSYYEVSDLKNNSAYYLNGVQVAALFGMNEEYKRAFKDKKTQGQVQLEDKLVSFYYREVR